MSGQRHIIKRQVLAFNIGNADRAPWLQVEVGRIYRQRIVPLIDRYCTELSAPDVLHRIEWLELDLGDVDPNHLEDDIVAKVRAQLRPLLAAHLRGASATREPPGQPFKTQSQLELLSLFAHTGSVPWWSDLSQPNLLDDCLDHLIHNAPADLRRFMRDVAQSPSILQRFVRHLDDERLAALVRVLTPSFATTLHDVLRDIVTILPTAQPDVAMGTAQLRTITWSQMLHVAGVHRQPHQEDLVREALSRIARALDMHDRVLITALHRSIQAQNARVGGTLRDMFETLYREQQNTLTEHDVLIRLLAQWQTRGGELGALAQALTPLAHWLPAEARASLRASLQQVGSQLVPGDPRYRQVFAWLSDVLRSFLRQYPHAVEYLQRWHQELHINHQSTHVSDLINVFDQVLSNIWLTDAPAQNSLNDRRSEILLNDIESQKLRNSTSSESLLNDTASQNSLNDTASQNSLNDTASENLLNDTAFQNSLNDTLPDLHFSDADELYISNAGLVILWPFLGHFFNHVDLLQNQQFKDADSQQRAIGLLQYIATEDISPPEYLIPLNKILCGMELSQVFGIDPPLSGLETEAGNDLLTAVIAQAPILNNMSPSGFRGTFLLRQGVLSARDGAWLLRVERETYDVVLDRLPWGFQWVKLPWMDTLLQVEW